MKKLFIIKTGSTFPATAKHFGDFEKWTADALGAVNVETCIFDAKHDMPLPFATECAGVVITGSHSWVTDNLPWSVKLEKWILSLLEARTPLFGICYGHQLIAQAAGGLVENCPRGQEIGTVAIHLLPECADDALFRRLPQSFSVHATHSQTVSRLPPYDWRLTIMNPITPFVLAIALGECSFIRNLMLALCAPTSKNRPTNLSQRGWMFLNF